MRKLKLNDKISYQDKRVEWQQPELEDVLKKGQWNEYHLTGIDDIGRTICGTMQSDPHFNMTSGVEIMEIFKHDLAC